MRWWQVTVCYKVWTPRRPWTRCISRCTRRSARSRRARWPRPSSSWRDGLDATAVVGPGTERGNEVLAHVAALLDLPLAANCVAVDGRRRNPRALGREPPRGGADRRVRPAPDRAAACDRRLEGGGRRARGGDVHAVAFGGRARARVVERVGAQAGGVSLADAKVVVSGGRGAGSAEGFAPIEELAGLLGAAVGCSRAVTMAGWRPHTDQVGQTGTKISPEIYIACGISGATQHMAGCKGAKRILAINADREAPILQSADYAVIGDMHEVVPALSAAIRAARS